MTVSLAEDILPGHPDRLADAIAERVVDHVVGFDPDAIASIEVALHRERVFVTGHVRAGTDSPPDVPLQEIVEDALEAAGYRGRWHYCPRVATDLTVEALGGEDERAARLVSEDQNIVVGHAEGTALTGYMPPAVHAVRHLRRALATLAAAHPDRLGPDGKVLARIESDPDGSYRWQRISVSIQHTPGPVDYEALDELVLTALRHATTELDPALPGLAAGWDDRLVRINGAGDFSRGGPFADNGQTGRKLVVDHYGPGVPIGGGALCGKDPHKVDRIGALAARQLAVRLVRDTDAGSARVTLGWLPGAEAPDTVFAVVDGEQWPETRIRAAIAVPDLSIEGTFRRLELAGVRWVDVMRRGYFGNGWVWEA